MVKAMHADVEGERGEAVDRHDLAHVAFGDDHVGRRERHAAGEGEIDEVPIDRVRGARELEPDAADVRLACRPCARNGTHRRCWRTARPARA